MKIRRTASTAVRGILALTCLLYVLFFQTTLPIEGVVVDAKTGQPVSKVLVRADWAFQYSNPVDTTGGGFGYATVSDERGRFSIPRRNVTSLLGTFGMVDLYLKHPLYDFQMRKVYSNTEKKFTVGKVEGGIARMTLPFTSLEDKFSRPEDEGALARAIDDCGPSFYSYMKDRFKVQYDLDRIMARLESLGTRFPEIPEERRFAAHAFLRHKARMSSLLKSYH